MVGLKPCLGCGELSEDSRCHGCMRQNENLNRRGKHPSKGTRDYDTAWKKLSAKARRLQPWCSDCGATEDLTCDHLPSAWERKAAGKAIRLSDVDVLCNPCNAAKGSSRPGSRRAVA